ncbi:MAG: EAL domain-containing protein [Pseudomonadota bacterium]
MQITTKKLEQLRRQQEIIEQLLRLSFMGTSLAEQLSRALDILIDIPWIPFTAKGGIFLADTAVPGNLTLFVGKNIPPSIWEHCGRLNFGECLCGQAAKERKFIFSPSLPDQEKFRYGSIENQSHYIVPIILGEHLLGILMLYGQAKHTSNENEQQFLETAASTLALLIERQQAADRLRISEENLNRAQRIAHLGYWDWDIHNNRISRSSEVFQIFGTTPREEPATFEYFLSLVHPDDVEKVRTAIQAALATNSRYSLSHRILRPDGETRIIHGEGDIALSEDGKPSRIFGTVQDITLLKHGEQQLHLAGQVFESSIEGITITDANGVIQSVNRAFTHITGYPPEEAVGQRPSILKSDRHDEAFYRAMWQTLLSTGRWEGEIWNRKKNGEVYPEWLTITAITDDFGQVSHNVAVFHDMSEVRGFEEQLRFQSQHDALTRLPNRTLLLDRLAVAIGHAQRTRKQVAVLAIDLDNFKHVNDSLGHTVGDLLLQQVAERLHACLPQDTTIARLGGDDFAVLIEELSDAQEAIPLTEAVIAAFARPFNLSIYETVITVSIGITFFPNDGSDTDNLLKNAELAMYRAKEEGKNKYQLFTENMNAQVMHRLSLENNLRKALDRREFLVYHQPKVSLATGRIAGMEALVRWRTPDGRLISPLDFIPLAEETGLIIPIGEQVLRQACLDARAWLLDYDDHLTLSVNLSPKQFMQKDLLTTVTTILHETDFPPERLELEITESAVMANEQAAIALLLELKGLGVRLALDDFGTGYSSLHYLRKLPFDTIKMDRAFVKDLPGDRSSVAIAITILTLADSLGMGVVAEGVETVEQLEFLRSRSCTEIQGYLFSPPVEAGAFGAMLREEVRLEPSANSTPKLNPHRP